VLLPKIKIILHPALQEKCARSLEVEVVESPRVRPSVWVREGGGAREEQWRADTPSWCVLYQQDSKLEEVIGCHSLQLLDLVLSAVQE